MREAEFFAELAKKLSGFPRNSSEPVHDFPGAFDIPLWNVKHRCLFYAFVLTRYNIPTGGGDDGALLVTHSFEFLVTGGCRVSSPEPSSQYADGP